MMRTEAECRAKAAYLFEQADRQTDERAASACRIFAARMERRADRLSKAEADPAAC
jgi:hypothetical protein